jgi:hypothetical protein
MRRHAESGEVEDERQSKDQRIKGSKVGGRPRGLQQGKATFQLIPLGQAKRNVIEKGGCVCGLRIKE